MKLCPIINGLGFVSSYSRLFHSKYTVQSVLIARRAFSGSAEAPVITKRVRTVVEEVVDGKVVSRTEDVDVAVVSK